MPVRHERRWVPWERDRGSDCVPNDVLYLCTVQKCSTTDPNRNPYRWLSMNYSMTYGTVFIAYDITITVAPNK